MKLNNKEINAFTNTLMPTPLDTVFLDEQYRIPGKDHLEEYRSSVFYNLLMKGAGERGKAYERIAEKILLKMGHRCTHNNESYGGYDLVVDGKKVELKVSRRASKYDIRKRSYRFAGIRNYGEYEYIMLMVINPNDTVEIWTTSYEDIKDILKKENSKGYSFELDMHPVDAGATHLLTIKMR